MGTFKSSKIFFSEPALIDAIVQDLETAFVAEGYEFTKESLLTEGFDISITKGGVFKALLGMKSALKVLIKPQNGKIFVEAGVGIFGQQVVPTIITVLVAWPVILTQAWGMVQQSKLDDKVMQVVEESIQRNSGVGNAMKSAINSDIKFCPKCGSKVSPGAKFCVECGEKF